MLKKCLTTETHKKVRRHTYSKSLIKDSIHSSKVTLASLLVSPWSRATTLISTLRKVCIPVYVCCSLAQRSTRDSFTQLSRWGQYIIWFSDGSLRINLRESSAIVRRPSRRYRPCDWRRRRSLNNCCADNSYPFREPLATSSPIHVSRHSSVARWT